MFRLVPRNKSYPPDEAYASSAGRFCDKAIATLYVTEDPEVAVAEYLRWNPELIEFQSRLKLGLFRFSVRLRNPEFDLTAEGCGVPFDLSTGWPEPEDLDPDVRYANTRRLARWVYFDESRGGIRFKSAAHRSSTAPNHVLFANRWVTTSPPEEVPRPVLDREQLVLLPG